MNIKKLLLLLMIFLTIGSSFTDCKEVCFVIDNFEDRNYNFNPEWFQFGDCQLNIKNNLEKTAQQYFREKDYFNALITGVSSLFFNPSINKAELRKLGYYSLQITGMGQNWYLGGIGTYLGIDLTPYNAVSMYVKGNRKNSGRLKIELFDDDANRWTIVGETGFDKWVYELNINWVGWKRVIIPFSDFKLENKGCGDGIWNPFQVGKSGGLIQLQLVALTSQKFQKSRVDFQLDEMYFIRSLGGRRKS
ncbi:MAG: hypothetical protein WC860_03970 [Candidatus Margulisiibacteriota bacterium]|jgi:hypothetical protein